MLFPNTISHNGRFSERFLFVFVCRLHFSCSETRARPAQQHFSPKGAENLPLLKTVAVQWDFKLLEYSCCLDRPDSFISFLCCAKASHTGCFPHWKKKSPKCNYDHWRQLHVGLMPNGKLGSQNAQSGCSLHRPKSWNQFAKQTDKVNTFSNWFKLVQTTRKRKLLDISCV